MGRGDVSVADAPVHVLMPAWNSARRIERSMASVLAELGPDDELVVVDDGSVDETVEAVQRVPDTRVRLVCADHGGESHAVNLGFAACHAPLIAFCDSDDWWLPGRMTHQRAALREALSNDALSVVTSAIENVGTDGVPLGQSGVVALRGTMLMPRYVVDHVGLFDTSLLSQATLDWWSRAVSSGVRFVADDRIVLQRVIHGDNLGVVRRDLFASGVPQLLRRHLARQRGEA
jgi:glycosyltransferase involved in cell wall biosynthesis